LRYTLQSPLAVFVYDDENRARKGKSYQHEAALVGFRVIVTSWKSIEPSNTGAVIRKGWQVSESGDESAIVRQLVVPDVVIHRKLVWGQSEKLLMHLVGTTECVCSYHPEWKPIGNKWVIEECFVAADQFGTVVPRPITYLVPKAHILTVLEPVGHHKPLIFKPADASLCEGIVLSSPLDFTAVAEMVHRTRWPQYVVQEVVPNPLLYNGRRFDLRVYALVTSFRPLRFILSREGVARIAAKLYDKRWPTDSLSILTGSTYRTRLLGSAENVSITELLSYFASKDLDVTEFWDRV
jgi:hypothetical protein